MQMFPVAAAVRLQTPLRRGHALTRAATKKGQALMLVLWAILLLTVAIFGVVEIVELSIEHTSYNERAMQARGLAMSGLALGLNPQLVRDDPLLNQKTSDGSTFKVTIASEGARLNLNYVLLTKHREILENLFTQWGLPIDQAQRVADCMYDWVTPGDQKSLNGAKAQDYVQAGLMQLPTYKPFDTFDEVKLVMGMDLLQKARPNWQDSFTLYSNGPLNVNEAPPELIAAVFSLDPQRVAFFTNARNGRDEIVGTYDDVKISSISSFASQLGISQLAMKQLGNQVALGDPHRRIESVGQARGTQVTIGVVTRLNTSPIEYFLWSRAVTTSKPEQKQVKSPSKGQTAVLLPGSTGAEPWELWVLRGKGHADMVQACKTPLENRLRKGSTLLLPISHVYCLPLWLNETDPKQFAGMIPLQLELRGLQPRGGEQAVFDWTLVTQEGSRALVVVGVLPATLPAEFHTEAYASFDLSARYLPLAENALTLWCEQDRLVLAITRGPHLVYFQTLTEGTVTARVVQEIICAQATLAMQDVVGPLAKIVAWTPLTAEEIAALKGALPLPVEQEDRPSPTAPGQPWKLVPNHVGEARRLRANRLWLWRGAALFLVAYLAVVGLLAWQYMTMSRQAADLRAWQKANEHGLDLVEAGRAQWKELTPVVATKDYPLELLLEVVQSIPSEQLHLTLFESGNGKMRIKGEAKNIAGAFQFYSRLKADSYFTGYNLEMANPNPLPNDLYGFQIEGTHAGY